MVLALGLVHAGLAQEPIRVRMMAGAGMGIPPKEATDPRSLSRRAVFEEFHRQNSGIRIVNAGGLEMTGARAESMFLMSMAGDTAPDVFYVNFRQYYNYIDQGFCRPLNDLIAADPASMARTHPSIMRVLKSYDGQVYAIPWFQVALGLYYRKDHFIEAGLDPNRPPRTWDDLQAYARKLSQSASGRTGFAFSRGPGYHWTNFVWQAGGDVVAPAEGGYWKATVASPAGVKALDFYRHLMLDKWKDGTGKTVGPAAIVPTDFADDIRTGKSSMWFGYTNDVVLNTLDVSPELIGVSAMPAGPHGSGNEINAGMWAINSAVKDPAKIAACWKFIQYFAGDEAARINTQRFVELGLGSLVNPTWLKKFGYADLVAQVDPGYVKANEELFANGYPEPYGRNCQQVYVILDGALDRAILEPDVPAMTVLQDVSREMDRKLLGYTPPAELARQRAWALGFLVTFLAVVTTIVVVAFRRAAARAEAEGPVADRLAAGTVRSRVYRFMSLCLAPAALSLLVWSYYPLAKGLVIAFQDYRIAKGAQWVGLDNFISVFTQPIFYKALVNSFLYVGLSILFGFLLPIFLALALNEIPRGKVFFRTVFYLPAMTSPIVVAFLWRQFYDKADTGLLNTVLAPFISGINTVFHTAIPLANDWLGSPSLAMFAVVLPGIWAGAGPGSILYLAALKNIPEERYEAADLDGASWVDKIRYLTLPGLKPLILINLLGVFIGGFKAMENIFVLTGGGPLYATHTMGLEIWTNAFMFLKFGYATAAAWVMGAILIGFTLIQIRSLLRMRFSAARL